MSTDDQFETSERMAYDIMNENIKRQQKLLEQAVYEFKIAQAKSKTLIGRCEKLQKAKDLFVEALVRSLKNDIIKIKNMFKRKKKTDLHGFAVITSKRDITIQDANKLWSVSFKKDTAPYTFLDYQIKNNQKNAKRLIATLWVTELVLSDEKSLNDLYSICKKFKMPKFDFVVEKDSIKVVVKESGWEAKFCIGTKWHGSFNYHLSGEKIYAEMLAFLFFCANRIFIDKVFLKKLDEILIPLCNKLVKNKNDKMTKKEEKLYLKGQEYLLEKQE